MGLIRLQNVVKQFGDRLVLNDLSLELHTGQTVGLVGANGTGKTTLFRIIAGALSPDMGSVTTSKGLEIGYLPQEPEVAEGQTLHDEVLSVFSDVLNLEQKLHEISEQMAALAADRGGPPSASNPPLAALADLMAQYDRVTARFEAAGGYSYEQRLAEILGGLGFTRADYELPMAALSGGQKCRAALAKLLLRQPEFLLLDEPTNHLDIDAVRWLEKFLAGHRGGAVIVSHDRYLLDRLADRIVELTDGQAASYPGNYSNYVQTKGVRELTQQRQYQQDRAFIERERAFIAKHLGKQRTAEAKGRRTRLERRMKAGEFTLAAPTQRAQVKIRFDHDPDPIKSNKNALEANDLCKQYGDKVLFTNLSLEVPAGRRLGITGPNGTGKTTLLRIVLGHVPADTGAYRFAAKAAIGYFAQETADLDPDKTIVQEIVASRPDLLESQARSLAARFLFRVDDPFKRIGQLSGGEQSRVRLIKLILAAPNVLVLDEPTNHLDIPSREVLEQALLEFPGTVIAVSHDRYFLDRICDRLLVMRLNQHALYQGNYSYYIEQVERERAAAEAAGADAAAAQTGRSKPRGRPRAPAARPAGQPLSRFAKLKTEELEALIIEREAKLANVHQRFGDAQLYRDPEAIKSLHEEYDALRSELAEAHAEWDRRAEKE
jgi:ATP-binding cassette subfamily F protein 3